MYVLKKIIRIILLLNDMKQVKQQNDQILQVLKNFYNTLIYSCM